MKKDLDYYYSLPYTFEVIKITKNEGSGFMAVLEQFGVLGIVGDGDSRKEAIDNLFKFQRERFQEYLDEGLKIPLPKIIKEK